MTSTQELERAAQAGISISNDVQEQLKCLLDNQHRALSSIKQQKVLDALAFNGMNQREETVEIADPDTFRWFLRPEDEVGQPQSLENSTAGEESAIVDEKGRVRKLFVEWLTNGTGIFHFTGKLGSGKSTLLKFLSTNELTKELLEKWAGKLLMLHEQLIVCTQLHLLTVLHRWSTAYSNTILLLEAGVRPTKELPWSCAGPASRPIE